MDIWKELEAEGVNRQLLAEVRAFRDTHGVTEEMRGRIPSPRFVYYGKNVWEAAAAAVLCGENLLLAGPKATGKNVLAENLAALFGRPVWDISMHINVDAASLIGTDTLKGGEVCFREGPVCQCARVGGFGVLDEVNMAKNEALAVLHAMLDFRRVIDIPGYRRLRLDDATRFIGTMNYGYAGTRELNEALVSRFVVVDMPVIGQDDLCKLLLRGFPRLKKSWAQQLAALFDDLRAKCSSGEISARALDLRGLLTALRLMERGLSPEAALEMGIINKAFAGLGACPQNGESGRVLRRLIWTSGNRKPAGRTIRSGTPRALTASPQAAGAMSPTGKRPCISTPPSVWCGGCMTTGSWKFCSPLWSAGLREKCRASCSGWGWNGARILNTGIPVRR